MRVGLLLLVSILLAGCSPDKKQVQRVTFPLSAPSSRANPMGTEERTRQELQLLNTYPEKAWITAFTLKAEPPYIIQSASLQFVYPERHYRKLSLPLESEYLWRTSGPNSKSFENGWGLPLRSNEPLLLEVLWRAPTDKNIPKATLVIEFQTGHPLESLTVRSEPNESRVSYQPSETKIEWPESLR